LIPHIISVVYDPEGSDNELAATIRDIRDKQSLMAKSKNTDKSHAVVRLRSTKALFCSKTPSTPTPTVNMRFPCVPSATSESNIDLEMVGHDEPTCADRGHSGAWRARFHSSHDLHDLAPAVGPAVAELSAASGEQRAPTAVEGATMALGEDEKQLSVAVELSQQRAGGASPTEERAESAQHGATRNDEHVFEGELSLIERDLSLDSRWL